MEAEKPATHKQFINQMEPWLGREEQQALADYVLSGGWLTEYKKTREFEKMIADYVGSRFCSVVCNGTAALFAALAAWGVGPGDEVIVPDFTMIASANAVALTGAEPIPVDVERRSLCLDLRLAEEAISSKTRAIVLVSLNGRAPDMDEARALARRHNLFLLEDSAQSLGSRWGGKHLGTFGQAGAFSFSAPKVITTGQGGALVTDDEALYKRILKIKDFGRAQSGLDCHETMGYNFKFTDLQAVIGIEQMKRLEWRVNRKKEMFRLYRELLGELEQVRFIETNLQDTSPWFIDILAPDRDALGSYLREHGIGTRPFYPAIHTQAPYRGKGSFLNSELAAENGLWLPSSSFLSDEDIRRICHCIHEFFRGQGTVW